MVFFAFDSASIDEPSQRVLDNVAASFRNAGIRSLQISGYSDRAGSAEYNLALSRRRAAAVKAALVARGVPARLLKLEALGEQQLLVETADGVIEAQNRHASIVVTCLNKPGPGFDYMRCRD